MVSILKGNYSEDEKKDSGCFIWDITTDKKFVNFLVNDLHLIEIINMELRKEKPSYRLKEIYFGVLSNCSLSHSFDFDTDLFFQNLQLENIELLSEMIKFLSIRLIKEKKEPWLTEILNHLDFFVMILENSLVDELIKHTLALLNTSSYYDEKISNTLSKNYLESLINSFIESIHHSICIDGYLDLLHTLSSKSTIHNDLLVISLENLITSKELIKEKETICFYILHNLGVISLD
eukprot:gene5891-9719_t